MKNFRSIDLTVLAVNKFRRAFLFSIVSFLFLISSSVISAQAQPSAIFDRMWIDYNIKEADQDGMRLHIKFTAHNLKASDCQIRVRFYYDDEKTQLKDNNNRYYTVGGKVALFGDVKPGYNPAVYEDFKLFMPYDELDLTYGDYELKMDVDLIYRDGEEIAHLKWYPFTYSKKRPGTTTTTTPPTTTPPPVTTATKPKATFERMWVEYDVTEGSQFGMRIHAKFKVDGMKGIKGYMAFFFERENGTRLKSYDNKYQSKGNDVAVYKEVTPAYDRAEYSDYSAFIPYSELHLTKGEHNLNIISNLIYEDGTFIQYLGSEKFRYWKQ